MTDLLLPSVLETDVGSRTQHNFWYQAACAARASLDTLRPESGVAEIYCEYGDDYLVKLTTGTFVAVQVKDPGSDQGLYSARHKDVVKSLCHFMELEAMPQVLFQKYVLETSGDFAPLTPDSSNLRHFLAEVAGVLGEGRTSSKNLVDFLDYVVNRQDKKNGSCIDLFCKKLCLDVLGKTELRTAQPRRQHILTYIADEIGALPLAQNSNREETRRAAVALVDEALEAGRLAYTGAVPLYVDYLSNSSDVKKQAQIAARKMTKERVERVLRKAIALPPLEPRSPTSIYGIPKGTAVTVAKMKAGDIPARFIHHELDLKHSAAKLFSEWIHGYDGDSAGVVDGWYNFVRLAVRGDCYAAEQDARQAVQQGSSFGMEMLGCVRKRLEARYARSKEKLLDLEPDHLLGVAGILTEECEVWWSDEFPITEEILQDSKEWWRQQYPQPSEELT